jgi:hypothetical protein
MLIRFLEGIQAISFDIKNKGITTSRYSQSNFTARDNYELLNHS